MSSSRSGKVGAGRGAPPRAGGRPRRQPETAGRPVADPPPSGAALAGGETGGRSVQAAPGPAAWVPRLAFVLCLLGLADSAYLVYVHFHPGALVCANTGTFNCQKVQTSSQAMVFGVIPVAFLGLGYFVVMAVLNVPRMWRSADIRIAWARLVLVVAGMGMVVYLVIVELFQIKAICEYCTGVHAITFALFVVTMLSYPALSYRARWLAWANSGAR